MLASACARNPPDISRNPRNAGRSIAPSVIRPAVTTSASSRTSAAFAREMSPTCVHDSWNS